MPDSPATLRQLVEKNQPGSSRSKYPEELQRRIAAYVHQQRILEVSYVELSRQIGLTPTTLSKWARKFPQPEPAFLPVHIRDTKEPRFEWPEPRISISSPNGWTIQGLDRNDLIAIIGRLS